MVNESTKIGFGASRAHSKVLLLSHVLHDHEDLLLSNLSTAGDTTEHSPLDLRFQPVSLEDMERQHILATLNHAGWNKSRTAILLGIERSTLDRKIRRYGLADDSGPASPSVGERN